jgi:hypothetical protein
MKWVYSIKYKLQAALVLTVIVFFVFAKNIVDRRNITELGKDFVSFYDDRLVVESYIFEITEHLFLMKLSVNQPELESNMLEEDLEVHRTAIFDIIEDFESTNLTADEGRHLSELKQKIYQLGNYADKKERMDVAVFNSDFEEAFEDVKALSAIQLYEGGKLLEESGRTVNRSGVWTQLEMAVLVILLVIIYLLIFSSRSIRSKMKQNPSLN